MTNQANKWIKDVRKLLFAYYGNHCCFCSSTSKLEFAHIQPTGLKGIGRGRKERTIDVLKHPDSYRLMCKDHHKNYDKERRQ